MPATQLSTMRGAAPGPEKPNENQQETLAETLHHGVGRWANRSYKTMGYLMSSAELKRTLEETDGNGDGASASINGADWVILPTKLARVDVCVPNSP